ncbi:MAG: Na+/H+ antiporter NhaA [Candidatus Thiodiazotropha sp. (ex Dulcina madagascariensis)]|nr:Na+/H+ antiporter NhaA [Candidatus Thiodiazotropha sp. (ex Dulcina madagascariensis)]
MSSHESEQFVQDRERLIRAPWEKGFDRILTPFEQFVKQETTSGLILMATALLALVLANSALAIHYQHLLHVPVGIAFGGWELEKSLHHWVNDGLMTLFFFVVGLELKREIMVGELANPRQAALPIIAAIGGMAIPALVFVAISPQGDALRGWGIPMATDIAFALGVIALLASRVPKALITFLVALAIVDDLGAVVVIALFYTEQLVWQFLVAGAVLTGLLVALNMIGVRRPLIYFMIGTLLWLALLKSGVHATLAGVITAFTIPALPRFEPGSFSRRMREMLDRFDASHKPGESILRNEQLSAVVQTLENGIHGVETPLQRLEHSMHMPVAFLVLPLFALFNAGVAIDFGNLGEALSHRVTLGVGLGLLVGKFIGIAGVSWLAIRLGLADLPKGVRIGHIGGAALLGGIGFTMSIFIAELAFAHQPEMILQAKLGILSASLLAGVIGYLWIYRLGSEPVSPERGTP